MTQEIEEYERNLLAILEEIEDGMNMLESNSSNVDKDELIESIKKKIKSAKNHYRSFKAELRDIPRVERKDYDQKSGMYGKRINDISNEFAALEENYERSKLMKGRTNEGTQDVSSMNTGQLLDDVDRIQDETKNSVERMQNTVVNAMEIGANTMAELDRQKEQLISTKNRLEDIESELQRADRQIRVFVRRMATDRCILTLVVFIVILSVVLVAGSIFKGDDSNTNVEPNYYIRM